MDNNNLSVRRELLKNARQVVVKAGTRLLTGQEAIAELVSGIDALRKSGKRVLLVTSGAVGMGMRALELKKRPKELAQVQALAAIGQCRLMAIYEEECRKRGFRTAQLLLTAADLRNRERYLNVMNCVNALWDSGVLPIVNENDSVSVAELKFGDNDTLAGMLASITDSQLTVILTTEQGLRERNEDGTLGERISVVKELSSSIRDMAGGTDNSEFSIGGMSSKLHAAEIVTAAGEHLWIADGREKGMLEQILAGEDVGTVFLPRARRIPGRKRWISFFSRISGTLLIDAGAEKAVREHGRSLLPSGVKFVSGVFKRGDTVEISGPDGVPFARGLVNFDAADCLRICGHGSAEIHSVLGPNVDEEVIHRDNLTLNIS